MKDKVFVSFDFEHDRQYKYLLEAWNANTSFEFVFNDQTPREINSYNVDRVKAALTAKIKGATHTLVIVGAEANRLHPDHHLIGSRNWINFEIHQSKLYGKKLVAVKLKAAYESPVELLGSGASWAMSFTEASIIEAIKRASER